MTTPDEPIEKDELSLRQAIIDACLAMNRRGLNQGTSGNICARYGDGFLITPSGVPYEKLEPRHIVHLDLHTPPDPKADLPPSSEWRFHRDILGSRPDVHAVVHAHPPYATALAINRMEIPAIHYMIVVSGGGSVRVADYALYGTEELSRAVLEALEGRTACLMANHGLVATGPSVERALWVAGEIENLAHQFILALQVGKPTVLTEGEVEESLRKLSNYGLRQVGPSHRS